MGITRQTVPAPVTLEQIDEARKALGRQLALWRNAAEMTQVVLARKTAYSRSAVANVEIGRQNIPRGFWEQADRELGAGGTLVIASKGLHDLVTARRAHLAWMAEQERLRRHQAAASLAAPPHGLAAEPVDCGCSVTVARWSGRETLALREALRLSLRAFAERLGVATATVAKWEDRRQPAPPSLAMQAVLDNALRLADQDARTRFAKILQMPPMRPDSMPLHGRPVVTRRLHRR